MAKGSKNIAAVVEELIKAPIEAEGIELWDVEYIKEGANFYLRITIDKEGGVDINDCEKIHRMIDPILDEADPIEGAYYLQVSSPGVERELRLPRHFEAMIGEPVELKLFSAIELEGGEKIKNIVGKLAAYDDSEGGMITLEDDTGKQAFIPRASVSKAHIVFDFD